MNDEDLKYYDLIIGATFAVALLMIGGFVYLIWGQ